MYLEFYIALLVPAVEKQLNILLDQLIARIFLYQYFSKRMV